MAYIIKGANVGASFLATLILARVAGASVVGYYSLAVTSATLVSIFASLGLDQVLLRQISGDLRQGETGKASATLRTLVRTVSISSMVLMAGYLLVVGFTPVTKWLAIDQQIMGAAVIGVFAAALFRMSLATIRGSGFPVAGQFFEGVPSFIFVAAVATAWIGGVQLTAILAVVLFFVSQLFATLAGYFYLRPEVARWSPAQPIERKLLYRAGLPIMTSIFLAQATDWLLLAGISNVGTAAEVGAFRVAAQIMILLGAIVATGEAYIASYMAGDMRVGRPDLAWRRHRRATWLMMGIGGIPVLLCLLIPSWILGFVFGPEFAVAGPAMAIMACGQAVALICGPVGALLVMAKKENMLLWQALAAFVIVAVLSFILIPRFGLTGAAVAYAITIAFRKLIALLLAKRLIPNRSI